MNGNKKASYLRRWETIQGEIQEERRVDRSKIRQAPLLELEVATKATAPSILADTFDRLRDWKTATALMNFTKAERGKIVRAINATSPLGFRSHDSRGASTTLSLHEKVDRLVAFILKIYSEYEDLPPIPNNVRSAMDTGLTQAKGALDKLSA